MKCDILGLQEVNLVSNDCYNHNQLEDIDKTNEYHHLIAKAQLPLREKLNKESNIDGNAIFCRKTYLENIDRTLKHQVMHLSFNNCCQLVTFSVKDVKIYTVNLNLNNLYEDESIREFQIKNILNWLDTFTTKKDIVVLLGGFNFTPESQTYKYITDQGFKSCYFNKKYKEPEFTLHKKIESNFKRIGSEGCYDYIL